MKRLFFILSVILLFSCGKNFDYSGVEVVDLKLGPNGEFAVVYYSNETVNVYSFEKLVNSFQRRAVFVSTSHKTYGGYFSVKDVGFLSDGRIYIVAYKPTLGWLVRIDDKELGYYSYISSFSYSDNLNLIGFVYNVGGEFSNDSLIGGKYYVNINGQDMGPYDYVDSLIFSKGGDSFAFSYSNGKNWYVKISDYEYVCYNGVILPNTFNAPEDIKFAYRIKVDWFLHPNYLIPRNIYKIISLNNYTFFVFTNSNYSFVSNNITNLSVEGKLVDMVYDGKNMLFLVQYDNKYKIFFNNKNITFDNIMKYHLTNGKVVYKSKNTEGYYVGIDDKTFGPYDFVDFYVEGSKVKIAYIKNGKLNFILENF